MDFTVTGLDRVLRNFKTIDERMRNRLVEATERTAVDIANAAKRDHQQGAHSMGRYERKTGHLTQSITPTDAEVTREAIIGKTFTDESKVRGAMDARIERIKSSGTLGWAKRAWRAKKKAAAWTGLSYAAKVEARFPYLFPALLGARPRFAERVRKAMQA